MSNPEMEENHPRGVDTKNEERKNYKPFLLTYDIEADASIEESIPLFGEEFVENNKENAFLEINFIESELVSEYFFPERGLQSVKLIIKNKIKDFSHMFDTSEEKQSYLKDITSLKFLNVSECTDLSHFFKHCNKIEDFTPIENWNVSNCKDFSEMFSSSSLTNTKALLSWEVSKGEDFSKMFYNCRKLKSIDSIKNWDVSSGKYFNSMFEKCIKLKEVNDLKFWKMNNAVSISYMFSCCSNLISAESNYKWELSDNCEKYGIFEDCKKIKNIPEKLNDPRECKIF